MRYSVWFHAVAHRQPHCSFLSATRSLLTAIPLGPGFSHSVTFAHGRRCAWSPLAASSQFSCGRLGMNLRAAASPLWQPLFDDGLIHSILMRSTVVWDFVHWLAFRSDVIIFYSETSRSSPHTKAVQIKCVCLDWMICTTTGFTLNFRKNHRVFPTCTIRNFKRPQVVLQTTKY